MTCSLTSWEITPIRAQYGQWRVKHVFPFVSMSHCTFPVFIGQTSANRLGLSLLTSKQIIVEKHASLLMQHSGKLLRQMIK
jgi:hypothetical protein